jgi:post-segregation antitoxin (ccd killing protein)
LKVCRHCGQRRKEAKFPRSRRSKDGLSSWCRACHVEATRRWREENRERINRDARVVPRYVYDPESKSTVPNPDPRPKSKVR